MNTEVEVVWKPIEFDAEGNRIVWISVGNTCVGVAIPYSKG